MPKNLTLNNKKSICCLFPGAPNVTNMTFIGQTATLTCISTGGPATNVTWRRDGVVIMPNATYQQTKRVIDNSTGTYQTVLTIDPSVDQSGILGTYNCTVENVRGLSSRTVVAGELFSCSTFWSAACNMVSYCLHSAGFYGRKSKT